MTSKADLAKESEKTRQVKEQDETIKQKAKETVHDVKKGAKEIAGKVEGLELKDADKVLPSVNRVDQKLQDAKESIECAKTAQVGDKDLSRYPKIQQVFKDTQKILEDNRAVLKEKTEDGTLGDTVHHTAELAHLIKDQSLFTLDQLWTNWAALLAVVGGSAAGSWKQILQESGELLNQLRYTQDFIKLLTDLQQTLGNLSARATKQEPVGAKLEELEKQWDQQRDQLMEDWKRIWSVLAESPLWKQLVAKGKALKGPASQALNETKEEVQKSTDVVAESSEIKKLKEDFKNILQLIVGKDGPDVQPFLDYCSEAYKDIVENEEFSKWASEMSDLFDSMGKSTQGESQEAYEKQMQKMYEQTKDLLDNTVNNNNLKLALRESKKLIRAAKKDPATKKLIADSSKLLQHISDKKGVNMMDPQLLNEIRALVVPLLLDHLDNLPLPDYHGRDSNALGRFDYTLSEIRMGTAGILPSNVQVEFRYKAIANPEQLKIKSQQMYMYVKASDIQLSFKDVKWHYNRHTIPRFSDSGTIDLATAGKGISLKLKAELHDYQPPAHAQNITELLSEPKERHMFTVVRAEAHIDDFHVRVSDAGGANVFYEMLAGIWGTKIKHQIESVIELKMNLLCNKFDTQLYDVVRRAVQPSLAEETKEALLSTGKAAGEKLQETAEAAKKSLQSM